MSAGWIIALICGGLIIAGLSFYLGRLLLLIKHAKAQQAEKIATRNKTLAENIYTITWAMRDGQCEFSEGCLRVWVLLDHYHEGDHEKSHEQDQPDRRQQYPGIFALYDKIKDMPTHEARKQLKTKALRAMDKERLGYEVEYKSLIETDIARLIERFGD